ncbi:hypothetical protein ACFLQ2_02665 [archaeon]
MPKADRVIGGTRRTLYTGGGGVSIKRTLTDKAPQHEKMKAWGRKRGVDPQELVGVLVAHLTGKELHPDAKARVATAKELVGVAHEFSGVSFELQDFNKLLRYGVAIGKLGVKKAHPNNVWHLPGEEPVTNPFAK